MLHVMDSLDTYINKYFYLDRVLSPLCRLTFSVVRLGWDKGVEISVKAFCKHVDFN